MILRAWQRYIAQRVTKMTLRPFILLGVSTYQWEIPGQKAKKGHVCIHTLYILLT